jgi:hypothetical protein
LLDGAAPLFSDFENDSTSFSSNNRLGFLALLQDLCNARLQYTSWHRFTGKQLLTNNRSQTSADKQLQASYDQNL